MQREVLEQAISAIQVRFGEQALVRASRLPAAEPWPTGMDAIDRLSGIGGLPRGRISVFTGQPTSGKLSLALAILALATRELAQAVVIDAEQAFDPWSLMPMKPELEALTVVRARTEVVTGEAAIGLARAGAGLLLILGSPAEPDLAPLESAAARSGSLVLAVVERAALPLAYASSLTIGLERTGWLHERGQLVGVSARARCIKNKLAPPVGEADLEISYPLGPGLFLPGFLREVVESNREIAEEEETWAARHAARSAVG